MTKGHLVLLTSAFPFGSREEFLEDEIETVASHFGQVTLVSELASGRPRSLPANCQVVAVEASDAASRALLFPGAVRHLLADTCPTDSLQKRAYMLRAILYYMRKASAITRATQRHLRSVPEALPLCFYSYWMDYKALAAADLAVLHAGSVAISRSHGYDLYSDRHPHAYLPLRRHIARRLAAVFPVSDAGARELRANLPGDANVRTARLGVVSNGPRPLPGSSLAAHSRVVISVGSMIPLKRVELLVSALATFGRESNVSWHHFGDGPLWDEVRRTAADQLHIPYSLPGYIPHQELRQRLRSADGRVVFASTSASEGLPVSMMEALAAGIPCVGTRVGGVSELIEDGVNGYLLPPAPSAAEVRHALDTCFSLPPEEYLAMRQAAFDTWSTRFDAAKNYSAFLAELDRILRHT